MFDTWRFVPITDISVLLALRPVLITDASALNTLGASHQARSTPLPTLIAPPRT